jgi:hypothetical protein
LPRHLLDAGLRNCRRAWRRDRGLPCAR